MNFENGEVVSTQILKTDCATSDNLSHLFMVKNVFYKKIN